MKFLTFTIMLVTLESLCLFVFKQTISMIFMSMITICAFLCFTANNWKICHKTFKKTVIGIFCTGSGLILLKDYFHITPVNNESTIDKFFITLIALCFILLIMAVFYIKKLPLIKNIKFKLYIANITNFYNKILQLIKNSKYTCNDKSFHNESSFDDYNPATGLPMIGGIDAGGNPYGTRLHDD